MRILIAVVALCLVATVGMAENIDPYDSGVQLAWGENVGWLNFEASKGPGVHVYADRVEGLVWAENIGWINLSPSRFGGVMNDGAGNLSGLAWGENVGWINFAPQVPGTRIDYGVKIDSLGNFSGYAWGENIGWIVFDEVHPNTVQVCVVTLDDLANLAAAWLEAGNDPANLDGSRYVDLPDFAILADYWMDYCPDDWPLK